VAASTAIRERTAEDEPTAAAFLTERGSRSVARLGRLEDALEHPALIAEREGRLVGVLTYVIAGGDCEVLTLHAAERWGGIGSALVERAEELARTRGCRRLWVLTTNDNVDALRFYQRRGFRLAELHAGAVDEARATLKPELPEVGDHGIRLRDELILEKEVGP
jgi:GNAT superfamily N-acetyltransferase